MNKLTQNEPFNQNSTQKNNDFYADVALVNLKPTSYSGIFNSQNSIEFIYCLSGNLKLSFPSEAVILGEGDFVFINAGSSHSLNTASPEDSHYCISFTPETVSPQAGGSLPDAAYFFSLLPEYKIFRTCPDSYYIYRLCKRCEENFGHDKFSKRLLLSATLMEISAYIFEKCAGTAKNNEPHIKNSIFADTVAFINQNYATATLYDAAKNMSMSYSYFSRRFKSEFNTSFSKYLTGVRIQKSVELLSSTAMSVSAIALACGFSNLSHFTKCFKEEKGITPNKFRSLTDENIL